MSSRMIASVLGQVSRPLTAMALLIFGLAVTGCQQDPLSDITPPKSVLLLTLDTTRADRIGAYGYEAAETENMDRLARQGILFRRCYSATPITLPSHTSILSGVYPPAHGIRNNSGFFLSHDAELISEVLQDEGYQTGAFVGSIVLDPQTGLSQGFDHYTFPTQEGSLSAQILERPAQEVTDDAIEWMRSLETDRPFFAWLHFFDPHADYAPPPSYEDFSDPYDGEIAYCDDQIGRLLSVLAETGLDKDLITIVTADHGEAFGEHGEQTHGIFVYDETTHVPLIISGIDSIPEGAQIQQAVSHTQVPQTLLEILNLAPQSLSSIAAPSLPFDEEPKGPIYLESYLPYFNFRWHPLEGIVWGPHKWIEAKSDELYELTSDPDESHNLVKTQGEIASRLREMIDGFRTTHQDLAWSSDRPMDDDMRTALELLGYVGSSSQRVFVPGDWPDPRERIGDLQLRFEAKRLVESGGASLNRAREIKTDSPAQALALKGDGRTSLRQALGLLEQIRKANPQDPSIDSIGGSALVFLERFEEAITPLEKACLLEPYSLNDRLNLQLAYTTTGRAEFAHQESLKILTIAPRYFQAYAPVVTRCQRQQDYGGAVWWLERCQENAAMNQIQEKRVEKSLAQFRPEMKRRGQSLAPPANFPVEDLTPEGLKDEGSG